MAFQAPQDAAPANARPRELRVPADCAGLRFDQAIARMFPDLSRSAGRQASDSGRALRNGARARPRDPVRPGDLISIDAVATPATPWGPEALALEVVHADEHLIVVHKPAGLVTHPGAGNPGGTLVNALLHYDPALAALPRAGLIHRLDKDTSGLLVVARSALAHRILVERMQAREIQRRYEAIVNGVLLSGGQLDAPIGRHRVHRTRMAVTGAGRQALTHFAVRERFRAHTWLDVQLETGRTHQIRVHMAHLKHPLVGDPQYGGRARLPPAPTPALAAALAAFRRQALHAAQLTLVHPVSGQTLSWSVPHPADFEALLCALREDRDAHRRAER